MLINYRRYLAVTFAVFLSGSVKARDNEPMQPAVSASSSSLNSLTVREQAEGWRLLFDGSTLNGWHVFQHPDAIPAWQVENGLLSLNLGATDARHGDLATDAIYENFELAFEWLSPDNGNSGVFINVMEAPEYPTPWLTGPEYQLLGTAHIDNHDPTKRSGGVFGFALPLTASDEPAPAGWNYSVIKQLDGKVEFYLNGKLTARVDFNSEEWAQRVSQSRFKDQPAFGASSRGLIVLQAWTSRITFRNIKIKTL